jgi:DNA-binding NtrC family response regulator
LIAPHLELGEKPEIQVLALVRHDLQQQIRDSLTVIRADVDFISTAAEGAQWLHKRSYQVALFPANLPGKGWWALWGEIALVQPRPEVLVYAHAASFRLWSGVLEAGGYDVLEEPFSMEQLKQAVLRASASFRERTRDEGVQ